MTKSRSYITLRNYEDRIDHQFKMFLSPPPEPRIVHIEESLGHWSTRIENEARREIAQQALPRERNQELRHLRGFLKTIGRFVSIDRSLDRMHPSRRPRALHEFWETFYTGQMVQAQEESIAWMGQRLAWYASILDEIDRDEHPARQAIRPHAPQFPRPDLGLGLFGPGFD
jgi:hypothetical protein